MYVTKMIINTEFDPSSFCQRTKKINWWDFRGLVPVFCFLFICSALSSPSFVDTFPFISRLYFPPPWPSRWWLTHLKNVFIGILAATADTVECPDKLKYIRLLSVIVRHSGTEQPVAGRECITNIGSGLWPLFSTERSWVMAPGPQIYALWVTLKETAREASSQRERRNVWEDSSFSFVNNQAS